MPYMYTFMNKVKNHYYISRDRCFVHKLGSCTIIKISSTWILLIVFLMTVPYVASTLTEEAHCGRRPTPQCGPEQNDCSTCYDLLAYELIVSDKNQFNLQKTFFHLTARILFLSLLTRNTSGPANYSATDLKKVWYWTQSAFYLFQSVASLYCIFENQ